jgi:hypothetical protein
MVIETITKGFYRKLASLLKEHRKMAGQEDVSTPPFGQKLGTCEKKLFNLRPFPVSLRCISLIPSVLH